MTRREIALIALFAGTLLAVLGASAGSNAQEYGARPTWRPEKAGSGTSVDRSAANEKRSGSVDFESQGPAYQRAIFEAPPELPATTSVSSGKYRRTSAVRLQESLDSDFDDAIFEDDYIEPSPIPSRGRRRGSINRAAYQQPSTAAGSPPVIPEDLPMPGDAPLGAESMPGVMSNSMGPYGDGSMLAGGCANGDCGDCATCGNIGGPCDTCVDWYPGKDLTLFAGVHGFKNAVDEGQNGNFGFQEGVNWSSPFWNAAGVGFQLGFQAMQSDFHETSFFSGDRTQYFVTTGFFRRQFCDRGWQWGVVYDYLSDEFVEDFDVGQIRGELSYLFRGHELGYWFASGASDDVPGSDSTTGITSYEPVDMHAFFYRRRLMNGGEGRLWVGFTKESDGLFGGDLRVPLACDWDVVGAFNYLAPQDDIADDGSFPESWNIGINLVWYVCPQGAMHAGHSQYRPLFNVADNGTLIVNTIR